MSERGNLPKSPSPSKSLFYKLEGLPLPFLAFFLFGVGVIVVVSGLLGAMLIIDKNEAITNPQEDTTEESLREIDGSPVLEGTVLTRSGAAYSHILQDSGGNVVAYLFSEDDKLKLVEGAIVGVVGQKVDSLNEVPLIEVNEVVLK